MFRDMWQSIALSDGAQVLSACLSGTSSLQLKEEWIFGGMVVTGENWNTGKKNAASSGFEDGITGDPYLWNLEFLQFRFVSFPEYVVHAPFHSEFVYCVHDHR